MWYDVQGTDPEEVIRNAFGCFDEDNIGLIHEDKLRELLTTIGDRYRHSGRFWGGGWEGGYCTGVWPS
jgi:Ca2+-binding EF-hand superfamily protein